MTATRDGTALLRRYDAAAPGLPKHAHPVVVLFPANPGGTKLVTEEGEGTYKIGRRLTQAPPRLVQ